MFEMMENKSNDGLTEHIQELTKEINGLNMDNKLNSNLYTTNPIGYLNEMKQKCKVINFDFKEIGKTGEEHCPIFQVICKITLLDGKHIYTKGEASNIKDAKKISAEKGIKQMDSEITAGIHKTNDEFEKYFTETNTTNEFTKDPKLETVKQTELGFGKFNQTRDSNDTNGLAITNPIGYLNEMKQNNREIIDFEFEDLNKSGEEHCPTFQVICKITLRNGKQITGKGVASNKKEAKKESALEGIRQMSSRTTEKINKSFDLQKYFSDEFCGNSCLNSYIESNENDLIKKLDLIMKFIGCSVSYKQFNENEIVLTVIIEKLNHVLITTYGFSDNSIEESKCLAAKKAIDIIQVLNDN